MAYETLLMIGGPWDRRLSQVEPWCNCVEVTEREPMPLTPVSEWPKEPQKVEFKAVLYRRERLIDCDGQAYCVMVAEGVKDPIKHLIYGYRQP